MEVMGWGTIGLVLSVPLLFAWTAMSTRRLQRSGDKSAPSSGGLLGFDELFHPAAHHARIQWETEQEMPAPSPTPDKGPGVIGPGNKITIVVDAERRRG